MYKKTLLNARDKNLNIKLAYNEFPYKNTEDDYKLEDRFKKQGKLANTDMQNSGYNKTAYNKVCIECKICLKFFVICAAIKGW